MKSNLNRRNAFRIQKMYADPNFEFVRLATNKVTDPAMSKIHWAQSNQSRPLPAEGQMQIHL